ncbi:MAG: hypothetical protein D6813_07595 [Calditrichaeota bacterium]|nr:MAG: hypothetical protein D6813_07595 [Calditrichota bacterium]
MKPLTFFILPAFIGLFLVVPGLAKIDKIDAPKCNGRPSIVQGEEVEFLITGEWVDHANNQSRVSGNGISLTVVERKAAGKNSTLKIRLRASNNARTGNRTVTLRYVFGRDTFRLRVIRRPRIDRVVVPTLNAPFQSVDITFEGIGIRDITHVTAEGKNNSFDPSLDAGGQPTGFTVTPILNRQTNTSNRATVRLNFNKRLSHATVEVGIFSHHGCSGLRGGNVSSGSVTIAPNFSIARRGLKRTVTLNAPATGPNFVRSHNFDRNNRTYNVGDVVTVTVELLKPVPNPQGLVRVTKKKKRRVTLRPGQAVYWALLPADAFSQAGPTGTAYNANAFRNRIIIQPGQQVGIINFRVDQCPGSGERNTVKLITFTPDRNDNQVPNRKETSFTILCQQ